MKYTTLFKFKKPDQTDYYNVADFNDNVDIMETELNKRLKKSDSASQMTVAYTEEDAYPASGQNLSTIIGRQVKKIKNACDAIGSMTNLKTVEKGSLVEAVNELVGGAENSSTAISNLNTEKNSILEKITELTSEKNSMSVQITELTNDKNSMSGQITELTDEKNNLINTTNELKNAMIAKADVGKTAKYYVGTSFYVPGDNNYHGLAIDSVDWNDISGLAYVPDRTNYQHYYTFPEGTYLVNIGLFTTTTVTSDIGVALKIRVNDAEMYNPWFRLTNNYQSVSYSCIIKGSKLCAVISSPSKILTISNARAHSFISFTRLS